MSDTRTQLLVGPADAGRAMTLDDFARVEGTPGYLYELARGVIEVSDVPGIPHGFVVHTVRCAIHDWDRDHGRPISYMAGGAECKLVLPGLQSARHPDLAVYLTPFPPDDHPWEHWIPDLVVEVVSQGSRERDHGAKREEYLAAGVREYWIVDPERQHAVILVRHGDRWREPRVPKEASGEPRASKEAGGSSTPTGGLLTTKLLPVFSISLATVLAAPVRGAGGTA
jgi:Uma2 family endonuclease